MAGVPGINCQACGRLSSWKVALSKSQLCLKPNPLHIGNLSNSGYKKRARWFGFLEFFFSILTVLRDRPKPALSDQRVAKGVRAIFKLQRIFILLLAWLLVQPMRRINCNDGTLQNSMETLYCKFKSPFKQGMPEESWQNFSPNPQPKSVGKIILRVSQTNSSTGFLQLRSIR